MLTHADADLAHRESQLPGLATLLDTDALFTALNKARPGIRISAASVSYLRYKPQTSCLAGYRVESEAEVNFLTATALRRDACAKQAKVLTDPDRIWLADQAITVALFPSDDKLPSLARLMNSDGRRHLLARIAPHRTDWLDGDIEILRYKPERRAVARLMVEGTPRAVLRLFPPRGFAAALAGARAYRSCNAVRIARLLGKTVRHRMIALEWLPGRCLTDALNHKGFHLGGISAVGAALAALHAQNPSRLPQRSRAEEAVPLMDVADWLAAVVPNSATVARTLARTLGVRLEQTPQESAPLHGDFYANQVLLDGSNVGIIDCDEACRGDPSMDLGTFGAHLEGNALRGHGVPALVGPVMAELIDSYRLASQQHISDERIALFAAVGLLRLAAHPFRNREPHWPERTASLLERADELLRLATPRTSARVECEVGTLQ
jgi:hypothetical protein